MKLVNKQLEESPDLPDLCSQHIPSEIVPELDILRKRMGGRAAFVFTRSPKKTGRILAASLNGPVLAELNPLIVNNGFQCIERAGCVIALLPGSLASRKSKIWTQKPQPMELEHLVARILGRLIVGSRDSEIFQVSESSSRCLALSSPVSLELLKQAEQAAHSDRPVLIVGDTGVGKELFARYIHRASGRRNFVAISMAQMHGETAISELFGHEQGAFTGATSRRSGAFLEAQNGTLFLDEISEMPGAASALLLRAIEEKRIKPLGADREIEAPARILAATNRPEQLRDDLFYRFMHRIVIPPLRDRKEDIRAISRFIAFKEGFDFSEKALLALQSISAWKGNARELEYFIFNTRSQAHKRCLGIHDVMRALVSPSRMSYASANGRSRVREVRQGLGLSLREFASSLGIPKSTLEDIEKGRSVARESEVIQRVTEYLERTLVTDSETSKVPKTKVKEELKRFLEEE